MTYSIPGDIRTKIQTSTSVGGIDSPFTKTRAVLDMMKGWEVMKAVSEGTEYLRENSEAFLPLEPREDYTAYMARVNRAVFSPFTQRLIRAATGLVLRKPIALTGDPYWTEMFKMDVDGCKSDLDEYARRILMCSLTYGQSHILVDYPAPSGALSLAEERQQNRRPYWIEVDPNNLFGYRLDRESNYGNLVQVRIGEKAVLPDGDFGEKVFDQVRVIEPGRYRVFRKSDQIDAMYDVDDNSYAGEFETGTTGDDYKLAESGSFSLGEIPLVISVNYAMATQPGNKVYYVEPASSAFEAQSSEIKELQMQMATLGISTLSQQKFVAESADARRLDRVDTNSMLAMVSMELEQKLQKAFNLSAEYVGIEPPEVKISRDFDIERLIGQDITALTSLFDQQVLQADGTYKWELVEPTHEQKMGDDPVTACPAPEPVVEPVKKEALEVQKETVADFEKMTKSQLETYGRTIGLELDKRHNKAQLIAELEKFTSVN